MSGLHPAMVAHAQRLQRHFRWGERVHRWLPRRLRPGGAALVGRVFTPDAPEAVRLWRSLQGVTGCSDARAHGLLAHWFASQGAWAVELHDYPERDASWARDGVDCDDRAALARLVERGGLLLTYHSHHHNLLAAFLGQSGTPLWAVAGTEEGSPYKPWTGTYIRKINGGSEALFNGGRYLFTDQMRSLLVGARRAFERGQTVLTVCDNPSPGPTAVEAVLFGRRLPVATGMIELALEAGAPVTFAILYSDLAGGHRCRIASADVPLDLRGVVRQYAQRLEAWVGEDPHAWQGLAWWDTLAPLHADAPTDPSWLADATQRYDASRPPRGWAERALALAGRIEDRLRPPLLA